MSFRVDPRRRRLRAVVAGMVALQFGCAGAARRAQPASRAGAQPPAPTQVGPAQDEDAAKVGRERFLRWQDAMAGPGGTREMVRRELARRQARRGDLARRGESAAPAVGEAAWSERGAWNQTGRAWVVVPSSGGDEIYVGTALGGLFRGVAGGEAWTPLGDSLGTGVHDLQVLPGSAEVWIATETEYGGVYRTIDGGASWLEPAGLPSDYWTRHPNLPVDLAHPDRVYALLSVYQPGPGWFDQIFRSDDRGATFSGFATFGTQGWRSNRVDLWIDRLAGGDLFALVDKELRKSTDGGVSFLWVGTIPMAGTVDQVALAGSEAGAPTLFAALHATGGSWQLWRSTDAGASWSFRRTLDDCYGTLEASPLDDDLVLWGGVNAYRSTDGGATQTMINGWWEYYGDPEHKLHADIFGLDFRSVGGGQRLFVATDGGVYESADGGATVLNVTRVGLPIAQYYDLLTSVDAPDLVAAGAQDQGYQTSQPAAGVLAFDQQQSGDYAHLTSSSGTHDKLYFVYPGGSVYRQAAQGVSGIDVAASRPSGSVPAVWMPPVVADPTDPDAVFFGADHLWRGVVAGGGITYSPRTQDFTSGAAGDDGLSGFAISPAAPMNWYGATRDGRLWYSHDGGFAWTQSTALGPWANGLIGTAIVCSPWVADRCWVGGGDQGGGAVQRTDDGGATWTPVGIGLPSTLVDALAIDSAPREVLYAATHAGPFRLDPATQLWSPLEGATAPLTMYWSVESIPDQAIVRFATYGRGIWDYHPGNDPAWCAADDFEATGEHGTDDLCYGAFAAFGAGAGRTLCDPDWAWISATTGATYRFETLALTSGTDTLMTLHDGCGPALASNDDYPGLGLASRIDWFAPAATYLDLRVGAWSGGFGPGSGYRLGVWCVADCPDLLIDDFESGTSSAWMATVQ